MVLRVFLARDINAIASTWPPQWRQRHDAGVVDEHIDAAMRGVGLGDDGLQVFLARDIQRHRLDMAALGAKFVLQGGEPVKRRAPM